MSRRLWIKARGTVSAKPLVTSVVTEDGALVDDVKGLIKRDFAPLTDATPKASITIYYYNSGSEDYIPLAADDLAGENPLPEVLSNAPGSTLAAPLFFDF